jgi:predicted DNA-binding protein (UPF0251 family)
MYNKNRGAKGPTHYSRTRPDRVARGERHGSKTSPEKVLKGEANGFSKLTLPEVLEIRKLYGEKALTQTALAEKFSVGQQTICRIVNRQSWTHV